jgi:hypothetical protein
MIDIRHANRLTDNDVTEVSEHHRKCELNRAFLMYEDFALNNMIANLKNELDEKRKDIERILKEMSDITDTMDKASDLQTRIALIMVDPLPPMDYFLLVDDEMPGEFQSSIYLKIIGVYKGENSITFKEKHGNKAAWHYVDGGRFQKRLKTDMKNMLKFAKKAYDDYNIVDMYDYKNEGNAFKPNEKYTLRTEALPGSEQ